MTWDKPNCLRTLCAWAESNPQIACVYLFGSRARGDFREDSDMDLAIELDSAAIPMGSTAAGEWAWEAATWRDELVRATGLAIDLQDLATGHDVVRPAVDKDGELVYCKPGYSAPL